MQIISVCRKLQILVWLLNLTYHLRSIIRCVVLQILFPRKYKQYLVPQIGCNKVIAMLSFRTACAGLRPADSNGKFSKFWIYTGRARKKIPLLRNHSLKSTSQICMIRILVKSPTSKYFCEFFAVSHRNIGKFNFSKIPWLQYAREIAQIIKDSLHRSLKKMQLFVGVSYPLYIIAIGLKIFISRLKIDVVQFERGEMPLACCSV